MQWPLNREHADSLKGTPGFRERRLFEDGRFFTPDARARFCFEEPAPVPEPQSPEFPLILMTGRGTSAQWHTETRTGKSAILSKMAPGELMLDLNEQDATALGVQDGDLVNVVSRRAGLTARARLTPCVKPGEAYLPMHDSRVNQLTHASFDPHSRQPSYKHSAVRVEKA